MMYNYFEAVKNAVMDYINENINLADYESKEEAYEELYDEMWIADSVTGNASGSYYCNRWKAEEALMHNLDLLAEAVEEFGGDVDILKSGAETCDVTIRCYLLNQALGVVLDNVDIWDYVAL